MMIENERDTVEPADIDEAGIDIFHHPSRTRMLADFVAAILVHDGMAHSCETVVGYARAMLAEVMRSGDLRADEPSVSRADVQADARSEPGFEVHPLRTPHDNARVGIDMPMTDRYATRQGHAAATVGNDDDRGGAP